MHWVKQQLFRKVISSTKQNTTRSRAKKYQSSEWMPGIIHLNEEKTKEEFEILHYDSRLIEFFSIKGASIIKYQKFDICIWGDLANFLLSQEDKFYSIIEKNDINKL